MCRNTPLPEYRPAASRSRFTSNCAAPPPQRGAATCGSCKVGRKRWGNVCPNPGTQRAGRFWASSSLTDHGIASNRRGHRRRGPGGDEFNALPRPSCCCRITSVQGRKRIQQENHIGFACGASRHVGMHRQRQPARSTKERHYRDCAAEHGHDGHLLGRNTPAA